MKTELTPKQQKFVSSYLELGNGVAASRIAGYKGNSNTLAVVASENIRKPNIKAAIKSKIKDADMGQDFVLKHLKRMAEDINHPTHSMQALDRLAHFLGIEISQN